jgi:glutamyl-tRNA synthetase
VKAIRTRFAPSPTGYLHVGGLRTALFSWLYTRHHQGEFILRIEDTDRVRSTPESVDAILDGLSWLGIAADFPVIYQSERMHRYQEVAATLLENGHAYRCECSVERLDKLREAQMTAGEKPRYDGHCRDLKVNATTKHVLRLKTPTEGVVSFDDLVYGQIDVSNHELDDLVLIRTDGVPTYNFAVVVDDWDMEISHVIRGDDHINNTPRQIHIYHALSAPMPIFAHLPMILGPDGKRLSKRHGAVSVLNFKEEGYLPQALLNYLVRLGWSHGDQEIFSIEDMIKDFNLAHVSRSACSFDYDKLRWLNQHYLKTLPSPSSEDAFLFQMALKQLDVTKGPSWGQLQALQASRYKTMTELVAQSHYFYEDIHVLSEHLLDFKQKEVMAAMKDLLTAFEAIEDWQAPVLMATIKQIASQHELKIPSLGQPLRMLLTGTLSSPGIDATLELLGKNKALERIKTFF